MYRCALNSIYILFQRQQIVVKTKQLVQMENVFLCYGAVMAILTALMDLMKPTATQHAAIPIPISVAIMVNAYPYRGYVIRLMTVKTILMRGTAVSKLQICVKEQRK